MTRDCNKIDNSRVAVVTGADNGKIVEQPQQLVSLLKKSASKSNKTINSTLARGRFFLPSSNQPEQQSASKTNSTSADSLDQDITSSSSLECKNSNKTYVMAPAIPSITTIDNKSNFDTYNSSLDKTAMITTNEPYDTEQLADEMTSTIKTRKQSATRQLNQAVKKSQKPRRRVATVAQRRAANIRERRRMFNLNAAFDRLRKKVPSFAYEKRLSRIETLKLAIMYIKFMDDLVNDDAYAEKYKQLTANSSLASSSSTSFLTSGHYLSLYRGSCMANQQESSQHQSESINSNRDIKQHRSSHATKLAAETKSFDPLPNSTVSPAAGPQYETVLLVNCSGRQCNGQCMTDKTSKSPLVTCCMSPSSAVTCHSSSSASSSSCSSSSSTVASSSSNEDLSPNSTASPSQVFNSPNLRHNNLQPANQSSNDHHQLHHLSNVYYSKSTNYHENRYNTTAMIQSITNSTSPSSTYNFKPFVNTPKVAYYQNYDQHSAIKDQASYTPPGSYISPRDPTVDSFSSNSSHLQCNSFCGPQASQPAADPLYKFDHNHQANQATLCHQDQQQHQQHLAGPPPLALGGQSICSTGSYSLHSLQAM